MHDEALDALLRTIQHCGAIVTPDMRDTARTLAMRRLKSLDSYLAWNRNQLDQMPTGVRPGSVSADIAALEAERAQAEKEINTIKEMMP